MGEFKIRDGTGNGYLAKIDSKNRIQAVSVILDENNEATKEGDAYNINTGLITLTDATETPILWLKNNNTVPFHITAIAVGVSPSTGGSSGINLIKVIRNPTAGTIVSGATPVDVVGNRNFGSPNELTDVLTYKGATGLTMTGGDDHIYFFQTDNGRLFGEVSEYLPKGSSVGVTFTPRTGNTSVQVYCAFICHQEEI